jgi:V-type H+-transporting ATPase subunit C
VLKFIPFYYETELYCSHSVVFSATGHHDTNLHLSSISRSLQNFSFCKVEKKYRIVSSHHQQQRKMYWIVSVPYDESKVKTVKNIKQKMTEDKLCECFEFKIPKLKVGTLDQFDGLSDDLIKYDATVESITMKILRTLGEVGEVSEADFNPEVILMDESTVPVSLYLNYFQWDENQYLLNKGLPETTELMYKKVLKLDDELKVKLSDYNAIKGQLQQIERKTT